MEEKKTSSSGGKSLLWDAAMRNKPNVLNANVDARTDPTRLPNLIPSFERPRSRQGFSRESDSPTTKCHSMNDKGVDPEIRRRRNDERFSSWYYRVNVVTVVPVVNIRC
ncbi:hypothetical protein M0802_015676 [Mischocyttarus mexicanus]|nr:hypothetical protein M0802_015676 [Mischocyttarus mexicanus]